MVWSLAIWVAFDDTCISQLNFPHPFWVGSRCNMKLSWGQPGKLKEMWCVDKSWQYALNMRSCRQGECRPPTIATCQPLFWRRDICKQRAVQQVVHRMKNEALKQLSQIEILAEKDKDPTWISLKESKQSNKWTHCIGISSDITFIIWPNVLDLYSHLMVTFGTPIQQLVKCRQ